MGEAGLGSLANRLIVDRGLRRVAILTSLATGNPALGVLDPRRVEFLVSVQYLDDEQRTVSQRRTGGIAKDLASQLQPLGLDGSMDLVVADPFHSYASSVDCLEWGLRLLRDGGVMLVHDCLPPTECVTLSFDRELWCGVTFAAFRDTCRAHGLEWCTVDADFGLGLALASRDGRGAPPERPWTVETHEQYLSRYRDDPYRFMRAIHPSSVPSALAAMVAGDPVDPLIQEFTGWPSPDAGRGEVGYLSLSETASIVDYVDRLEAAQGRPLTSLGIWAKAHGRRMRDRLRVSTR